MSQPLSQSQWAFRNSCRCFLMHLHHSPILPKITLSHSNASFHILNFFNLGLEILSEQAISIRRKNYSCDSCALFISWWRKRRASHIFIIVAVQSGDVQGRCSSSERFPAALTEKWEMTSDHNLIGFEAVRDFILHVSSSNILCYTCMITFFTRPWFLPFTYVIIQSRTHSWDTFVFQLFSVFYS